MVNTTLLLVLLILALSESSNVTYLAEISTLN